MRISGINIPDEKKTGIALTYIFGIGKTSANQILHQANIDENKKAKELKPEEVNKIQSLLEKNHQVEGELKQIIKTNISTAKYIKTYRGLRHQKGLPVRGQRTKSNSRTVRGNVRKTAGSGKRKMELK